jgi:SET and MYND domain-containing protein
LNKNKSERNSETHELYNGLKRSFNDLMTHSNEILEDMKRIIIFNGICNLFKTCHIDFDWGELFELFCKTCINSFAINCENNTSLGIGLYISGSALNHSCAPNAAYVFNGTEMEVRAIKPISSGEEVFIHYLDIEMDRNERKTKLREKYYFECNCIKCSTHSDSNIDYKLVKTLEKRFGELSEEESDWNKCYEIGMKKISLFHQIYGDFHPIITVQYIRVLKAKTEVILSQ